MDTFAHRPIDQLNTDWAVTGRTPGAARAMARLAACEPTLAALGCADLAELVTSLRRPGSATGRGGADTVERERAAAAVRCMLRSAAAHPLVPRAILQALVPGLVTVARRLRWGRGGDWDDGGAFFGDLLALCWEVIEAWSGEDRPYAAPDILSAVRCRMRRRVASDRAAREREVPGLDAAEVAGPAVAPATDLEELTRVLLDLAGHGIAREDAAVLYGHRVLGYSTVEMSRMTGRSRRSLDARRRRALALLGN
jgi:hypothetical protein